ncbi:MAG: hypothetical protein M3N43_11950 [Actinomycetota bacterium]|nr:hypothetical protein [Actinomycetota bacterium]
MSISPSRSPDAVPPQTINDSVQIAAVMAILQRLKLLDHNLVPFLVVFFVT